jgi:transposase
VPAVVDGARQHLLFAANATSRRARRSLVPERSRRWRNGMGRPRCGREDPYDGAARIEGRRVIGPTGAVCVRVATKPVDFRKGAEGLSALVRETMAADPFSGAVYVFLAKRADRIKLIFWDGTGLCLFAKRLEDGVFRWPKIEDGVMRLSAAQLSGCLMGWTGGASVRRARW